MAQGPFTLSDSLVPSVLPAPEGHAPLFSGEFRAAEPGLPFPSASWHPVSTPPKVSAHTLSFHSPFRSLAQKLPIHFDNPEPPFIHLVLGGRSISVKLD